jgi:hypothetical protein
MLLPGQSVHCHAWESRQSLAVSGGHGTHVGVAERDTNASFRSRYTASSNADTVADDTSSLRLSVQYWADLYPARWLCSKQRHTRGEGLL